RVLHLAFPSDMWDGAPALRILCLGMGSFSVLGVTCAALSSLGRAFDSAALTLLGVVLITAGCIVFVQPLPAGLPMLATSAAATPPQRPPPRRRPPPDRDRRCPPPPRPRRRLRFTAPPRPRPRRAGRLRPRRRPDAGDRRRGQAGRGHPRRPARRRRRGDRP